MSHGTKRFAAHGKLRRHNPNSHSGAESTKAISHLQPLSFLDFLPVLKSSRPYSSCVTSLTPHPTLVTYHFTCGGQDSVSGSRCQSPHFSGREVCFDEADISQQFSVLTLQARDHLHGDTASIATLRFYANLTFAVNAILIRHFRVALNLIVKSRLRAKFLL